MLRKLRPRITYANVISTLCLFMLLGSGAYAATSFVGSDGEIHGCVDKRGHLTVLKSGAKCGKGKSAVAWNQTGPQGVRGMQGAQGIQGIQGIQGPTGDTGPSTGRAGGDLTGNYPAPTIRAVPRNPVAPPNGPFNCTTPETGQFCSNPSDQWSNYENGYAEAEFFKDRLGLVHLQGSVAGGSASIPIFYLPPAYRPTAARLFIVRNDSVSAGSTPYVRIGTDGSVTSSVSASYLSLDGISFAP